MFSPRFYFVAILPRAIPRSYAKCFATFWRHAAFPAGSAPARLRRLGEFEVADDSRTGEVSRAVGASN